MAAKAAGDTVCQKDGQEGVMEYFQTRAYDGYNVGSADPWVDYEGEFSIEHSIAVAMKGRDRYDEVMDSPLMNILSTIAGAVVAAVIGAKLNK